MEPPINQSMRVCLGYWAQHASTINMNHFSIQAAQQVGDEVTKDEPITTNPNVGGFGQDGFGWELEIAVGRQRVTGGFGGSVDEGMSALRRQICWVDDGYTPIEILQFLTDRCHVFLKETGVWSCFFSNAKIFQISQGAEAPGEPLVFLCLACWMMWGDQDSTIWRYTVILRRSENY